MRRWAQEISTTPWLTYGIPDYGLNYQKHLLCAFYEIATNLSL